MKLRKVLPILSLATIVPSMPIALTSCSNQYTNLSIISGYTPKTNPKDEVTFNNYEEATKLYKKLDKKILIEDYLWTLGHRVLTKFDKLPQILPFNFTNIDNAIVSVEKWWTQDIQDSDVLFSNSFSLIFQLSGDTEPTEQTDPQLRYAYCILTLHIDVERFPYYLDYYDVDKEYRWFLVPLIDQQIISQSSVWSVSATATLTYKKKYSHDETISRVDNLGVYWNNEHMYDPGIASTSYLYETIYDSLFYRSYYLQNCMLKQ